MFSQQLWQLYETIKPKPPPTATEIYEKNKSEIEKINSRLIEIEDELQRRHTILKNKLTSAITRSRVLSEAKSLLDEKNTLERSRHTLMNSSSKLANLSHTSERMKDTATATQVMKATHYELKKQLSTISIGEIDRLNDEMEQVMQECSEIDQAVAQPSSSYSTSSSYSMIDGSQVERELASMFATSSNRGEEELADMFDYLNPNPSERSFTFPIVPKEPPIITLPSAPPHPTSLTPKPTTLAQLLSKP